MALRLSVVEPIMSNLPRPHRINIDLGPYKDAWLAYCHARQVTPSAAFRQIVATLIKTAGELPAEGASAAPAGKVRMQITLTGEEARFIANCALAEGYSSTRWLIALLQIRMGKGAQFGQYELEALARSNQALLVLGRNINQIARAVNAGGALPRDIRAVIGRIEATIQSHTAQVSHAIACNMERWNAKWTT